MKRLVILGSTGSIGENALSVARALPEELRVVGLSAHRRWERLTEQAAEFHAKWVAVSDPDAARSMEKARAAGGPEILGGPGGLVELVRLARADMVLTAVTGAAGLPATVESIRVGSDLAVANKEPLVMAGGLIVNLALEAGVNLLPVDSEHSAAFQALGRQSERVPAGQPAPGVRRVILTASGGPFRERRDLSGVTVQEALNHPTWSMGPKITIDSATMMNKALEVVEACWLFGLSAEQVEVVVHPQSLVHAIVEFEGGSMLAQMSAPDMRVPIQYALTYPRRVPGPAQRLNVQDLSSLTFEPVDHRRFPAVGLGFRAAREGGTSGAVLNAANEVANQQFRDGRIRFTDIADICRAVLDQRPACETLTLDSILAADAWARGAALQRAAEQAAR